MQKSDPPDLRLSAQGNLENIFDHAQALARVEGDAELLAEMAALFLESYVEQLSAIRAGLACGDLQAVKNAAHSLKGAVGNFAARESYEAAQSVEETAGRGDLTGAERAYSGLDTALERLRGALGRLTG